MQTAIKLIIKGKVYGSVGDNHRDSSRTTCNNNTIAKAEIDAWQVDVRSLETTKALGQDEVNMNGIYIKFGCTKVKQEKGIST